MKAFAINCLLTRGVSVSGVLLLRPLSHMYYCDPSASQGGLSRRHVLHYFLEKCDKEIKHFRIEGSFDSLDRVPSTTAKPGLGQALPAHPLQGGEAPNNGLSCPQGPLNFQKITPGKNGLGLKPRTTGCHARRGL